MLGTLRQVLIRSGKLRAGPTMLRWARQSFCCGMVPCRQQDEAVVLCGPHGQSLGLPHVNLESEAVSAQFLRQPCTEAFWIHEDFAVSPDKSGCSSGPSLRKLSKAVRNLDILNAVQAQLALKILMGLIRKLLLLNKSRNLEKIVAGQWSLPRLAPGPLTSFVLRGDLDNLHGSWCSLSSIWSNM